MKKLMFIFLTLITMPVMATEIEFESVDTSLEKTSESPDRSYFIGGRLHRNSKMYVEHQYLGKTYESDTTQFGLGLNFGAKLNEYLTVEYELSYTGSEREWIDEKDTYDLFSNMINLHATRSHWKEIAPYIGAGIGLTKVTADMDAHAYGLRAENSENNFAWQLILGVDFIANDRFNINFGAKYVNYGDISHVFNNTNIPYGKTNISSFDLYTGIVYKFGL